MSPFARALAEFSEGGRQAIADAHGTAIACGANFTGTTHEQERACTAQDLLCLAGDAAVDVAMIAQIFEAASAGGEHARMLRDAAAGMSRLCARALEIHARDTGYDSELWIARAIEETEIFMIDDRDELFDGLRAGGESVALARRAASSVHAALACAPADRMGVPGHVAAALGAGVAVFMLATAAEDDA